MLRKTNVEKGIIGGIIMKLKKYIRATSFFIVLFTILNSMISVYAVDKVTIPDEIVIRTSKDKINSVQYENYTLSANKIKAEGRDEVVYCLEIDQSYPSGEVFRRDNKLNEEVDGIITNGYPNVSFEELNLSNENDAYFATQIAIWSCLENYDINKIKSNNMAVLNAIKTIYSKGMAENKEVKYGNVEYISPNESVQRVVMVFEKMHPAQEG